MVVVVVMVGRRGRGKGGEREPVQRWLGDEIRREG